MTRHGFEKEIRKQTDRKIRRREEGDRGIWFGLGMMGVVGWSVSIPTLLGIAAGIWLDARTGDRVSWTLTGLVVGLAIGLLNAWFWVQRESRHR
ncbi:MAG: AtpZ/AtpI family protein [Gemmatimonadota bacterium]